jgi:hypothetical protein
MIQINNGLHDTYMILAICIYKLSFWSHVQFAAASLTTHSNIFFQYMEQLSDMKSQVIPLLLIIT